MERRSEKGSISARPEKFRGGLLSARVLVDGGVAEVDLLVHGVGGIAQSLETHNDWVTQSLLHTYRTIPEERPQVMRHWAWRTGGADFSERW